METKGAAKRAGGVARTGQHTGQLVVAAPPAANVEIRYWQPETKHMREAKCLGVDRERQR